RAGLHRDRHGLGRAGQRAGEDRRQDPGRPAGQGRRDRARRDVPGRRRCRLHHRLDAVDQRRPAHVLTVKLNRRLLLAASAAAIPIVARAQELAQDRKKIVVGLLSWWPPFREETYARPLREVRKAFGYVEGRNLELLVTFTGGNVERAREAAKAYVDRGVDVIVATATPAVTIAKQATETKKIPY